MRSCTSDRRLGTPKLTPRGLIRVVHPYPSTLDAAAVTVIASIAGAEAGVALRLGLGMLFLQFAIGSINDVADAGPDARVKPAKPIPSKAISRSAAVLVAAVAAVTGLALALSVSAVVFGIGLAGLLDGLLYDLRLKGTALSWAPFAAGVGLLPIYAWVGATGHFALGLGLVAGLAVAAGLALALANAYSDLDKDRRSGVVSVATLLGSEKTLLLNAAVLLGVDIVAVAISLAERTDPAPAAAQLGGMALSWLGLGLSGRLPEGWRHLVWEVQALGFVVLGTGWLAAISSAGLLRP